jgi:hypothetical protein
MPKFDRERFNLQKLNETEGNGQSQVNIPKRFAALKNLDKDVEINSAWETARQNIKISPMDSLCYYELKAHKSRLSKGCNYY